MSGMEMNEIRVQVNSDRDSLSRRLTMNSGEWGNETMDKASSEDVSAKWDVVVMFGEYDIPKDKEGKPVTDDKVLKTFNEKKTRRQDIVQKIQEAFPHSTEEKWIQRKKSADGSTIYFLLRVPDEILEAEAEDIGLILPLKEAYGGGSAPFEKDHRHLFLEVEDGSIFRKIQRINLADCILRKKIDVDEEIREGTITRIFPLHQTHKLSYLLNEWSHPKRVFIGFWDQPLTQIREYFGEEITMYFAWLGFYTNFLWIATLAGLICTGFWAVPYFRSDETWTLWSVTIYCVFLALWSTAFLEFWKRKNNRLIHEWNLEDFHNTERERPDYRPSSIPFYKDIKGIDMTKHLENGCWVDGTWVSISAADAEKYKIPVPSPAKHGSIQTQRFVMFAQLPFVSLMVAMVVVLTLSVLSFRLFVQNFQAAFGSVVGGIANAIVIMVMNGVWKNVAVKLNDWENHRTESQYDNSLILKIFAFYFVNSYTSLFYIAFFKGSGKIFGAEALKDGCKSGSRDNINIGAGCINELTIQLVTLLLTNMFVGQTKEVLIPYLMSKMKIFMTKRNLAKQQEEKTEITLPQWEQEAKKGPFPGTFDEYSEMVLQYGYITMFAASFPLAPLLAVLNNVIEVRTDAFKLLAAHSRPFYKGATGIGAWYDILNFLGIASVITNCLLIGYTLDSIADAFGSVPYIPSARRISQVPYHVLIVIVLIEHALFAMKAALSYIIPDVPGDVQRKRALETYIKEKTLEQLHKHTKEEEAEQKMAQKPTTNVRESLMYDN